MLAAQLFNLGHFRAINIGDAFGKADDGRPIVLVIADLINQLGVAAEGLALFLRIVKLRDGHDPLGGSLQRDNLLGATCKRG